MNTQNTSETRPYFYIPTNIQLHRSKRCWPKNVWNEEKMLENWSSKSSDTEGSAISPKPNFHLAQLQNHSQCKH